MRPFLSSCHEDANRPIVDPIAGALRKRHDVWVDRSEIKTSGMRVPGPLQDLRKAPGATAVHALGHTTIS